MGEVTDTLTAEYVQVKLTREALETILRFYDRENGTILISLELPNREYIADAARKA